MLAINAMHVFKALPFALTVLFLTLYKDNFLLEMQHIFLDASHATGLMSYVVNVVNTK